MEEELSKNKGVAIPLVIYSQRKFMITEEAKEILNNPKYKHIGIISLVGKYRTGKSFLLNRVLLNQKRENGFGVAPTIKPCTKGIWMWNNPTEIENENFDEKFHTFFIDTEGLGAYDEEINHDSKIFLIAILISSLFILNSFGNIDENAINSLSFILNISKTIKLKQNSNNKEDINSNTEQLAEYFPSFLWLLRDFSLKLEDSQGNSISAKQYLENALQLQKGSSDSVEEKNKVRKLITSFFMERDCFSMVRPVENEKDLQNIQTLEDIHIRKEFLEQAETLRSKVFKKVKPKIFNNKILSGSMLIEILENILDSINKGAVPIIENSWKYMLHNESLKCMNLTLDKLKCKIREFKEINKENLKFFKEFDKFEQVTTKKLIDEFLKEAISPESPETQECLWKIKANIIEEFKKFYQENTKVFENQLFEFFENNTKTIYENLENDRYFKNHYVFFRDLENLKDMAESSIPDFTSKKDLIYDKILIIIKKFIELVFLKNINRCEQEISVLKGENSIMQNKYNFKKEEYEYCKIEHVNNINRLNKQISDLKLREKNLEEKYCQIINEKSNENSIKEENIIVVKKEYESKLEKLKSEIVHFKNEIKNKEEQILILKFSEEKLTALNKQKIEFLEKENLSYKERYDSIREELEKFKEIIEGLNAKIESQNQEIQKRNAVDSENLINKNLKSVTNNKKNNNINLNNNIINLNRFNNPIKNQIIPKENYNSGPLWSPSNNHNNLDNDNQQLVNNSNKEDNILFKENFENYLVDLSPILANKKIGEPYVINKEFNIGANNSMNNSLCGLNYASEIQIQQQKVSDFFKEIKNEQMNENKKILSDFKLEIVSEMKNIFYNQKELIEENKLLTMKIAALEKQSYQQELKFNEIKDRIQVIEQVSAFKCVFCSEIFQKEFFLSQHSKICRDYKNRLENIYNIEKLLAREDKTQLSSFHYATDSYNQILTTGMNNNFLKEPCSFQFKPENKLTLKILDVELLKDNLGNEYKNFLIEINIGNKKIYNINKCFHDFMDLNKTLRTEFYNDSMDFLDNQKIFYQEFDFESNITESNLKALENYLNELSSNPKILTSLNFNKFFNTFSEDNKSIKEIQNFYVVDSSRRIAGKINIEELNEVQTSKIKRMSQKKHLSSNLKLEISTENEMLKNEDSIKITADDNPNDFQHTYDINVCQDTKESIENVGINILKKSKATPKGKFHDYSKFTTYTKVANKNSYAAINSNLPTPKNFSVINNKFSNKKQTNPLVNTPRTIQNGINNTNEVLSKNTNGKQKLIPKLRNLNNK